MQIVSIRDILHDAKSFFSGKNKKKYFNMSSAKNFSSMLNI